MHLKEWSVLPQWDWWINMLCLGLFLQLLWLTKLEFLHWRFFRVSKVQQCFKTIQVGSSVFAQVADCKIKRNKCKKDRSITDVPVLMHWRWIYVEVVFVVEWGRFSLWSSMWLESFGHTKSLAGVDSGEHSLRLMFRYWFFSHFHWAHSYSGNVQLMCRKTTYGDTFILLLVVEFFRN